MCAKQQQNMHPAASGNPGHVRPKPCQIYVVKPLAISVFMLLIRFFPTLTKDS
jgi:hypothetical protein